MPGWVGALLENMVLSFVDGRNVFMMPSIITTHKHVSPLIVVGSGARRGLSCSPVILELQRPNTAFCLFFSSPPHNNHNDTTTTPPTAALRCRCRRSVPALTPPIQPASTTSGANINVPCRYSLLVYVNLRSTKEEEREKETNQTSGTSTFIFLFFLRFPIQSTQRP